MVNTSQTLPSLPAMVISLWASVATWFTPTILFCFLNLMIGSIFIASKFKIQKKQHQLGEHNSPQLARAPSLLARVKSINLSPYKFDHHYPSQSETQFTDSVQEYRQTERENENYGQGLDHHVTRSKSDTREEKTPERVPDNSPQQVRAPSLLARVKSINFSLRKFDHRHPYQSETQFADPGQDYPQIESETENHGPGLDHHVTRSKSDTREEATTERAPAKLKKSAIEKAVGVRVGEKEEVELRRPATVRERKSKVSETEEFMEEEGVDAKADDFINMFRQQLKLQRLGSLLRYNEMLGRGSA